MKPKRENFLVGIFVAREVIINHLLDASQGSRQDLAKLFELIYIRNALRGGLILHMVVSMNRGAQFRTPNTIVLITPESKP